MRLWPFSRWQRQRSGTAESWQLAYQSLTLGASGPMIGVACENRRRAVDLLGKNDTGETVRQGYRAERERLRPTWPDTSGARPSAPPITNATPSWPPSRNFANSPANASLDERHAGAVEADQAWEGGTLASSISASASCGPCAVAALDSATSIRLERRQMEFPAGDFGAAEIMREEVTLRPLLELANGSDQEPHSCSPSGQRGLGQPSIRSPAAPWADPLTTSSRGYRTREPPAERYGR